jgi:hypothetical protein
VLLQIGALRSAEALANLNTLSFGARNQIGVISLADADLLQEAGRPTLIILNNVLEWGGGVVGRARAHCKPYRLGREYVRG